VPGDRPQDGHEPGRVGQPPAQRGRYQVGADVVAVQRRPGVFAMLVSLKDTGVRGRRIAQ
jgi:hypothetical protein